MSEDDIISDVPAEQVPSSRPWEPWRCTACGVFVYNLDDSGNPAPGAPVPRYISRDFPIACSVCWSLYTALDNSDYFKKIMRDHKVTEEERAKRNKKLGPGGNYFPE